MPIYVYTYTHSGYAARCSAYALYTHSRYIYIHVFITCMPVYIYYIHSRYTCLHIHIPVVLIYIHTFTNSSYAAVHSGYATRHRVTYIAIYIPSIYVYLQPIPLGVTFSKAQSSNVSFATFQ